MKLLALVKSTKINYGTQETGNKLIYDFKFKILISRFNGGGDGIRTHDTVSRIHAFQACAFDRSATPPLLIPEFCISIISYSTNYKI